MLSRPPIILVRLLLRTWGCMVRRRLDLGDILDKDSKGVRRVVRLGLLAVTGNRDFGIRR